jgi:hypothetical protein
MGERYSLKERFELQSTVIIRCNTLENCNSVRLLDPVLDYGDDKKRSIIENLT